MSAPSPSEPSKGQPIALVATFGIYVMASASAGLADSMPLPSPLVDEDFLYNGKAPPALVELGRNLFFDPVLSGNQNISCGACHDPRFGTGDGLALGIGEGGSGAGSERRTEEAVTGRVPRNAPALWNLGAIEVTAMFHDGRLERMADNPPRYRVPAGGEDAKEAASLLAAQAFFPVSSPIEMAGQRGENVVADAVVEGRLVDARELLADRVSQIDAYLTLLEVAFNDVNGADDVRYLHIAEALAAFQADTFRSDNSPFDSVLRTGDRQHLSADAQAGIDLFYGTAGCAACHSGPLLTDHDFHAIAVPQIGPGKGHGFDKGYWQTSGHMAYLEDEGRYQVTGDRDDIFAFRTPSLRNVAQSGPWGHSGAFQDLEDMVRHHLDATASLANFDATLVPLPQLHSVSEQVGPASATGYDLLSAERKGDFDMRDAWVQASVSTRSRIAEANDLAPVQLSETEIKQIMAFLEALTDPEALERGSTVPKQVPSGLPPQPQR